MAATFARETLDRLDEAFEIDIETRRGPDSPVHRTTIWIVVDSNTPFVRSVRGPAGRWYRELVANPHGAVYVGDQRIAVSAQAVEDVDTIGRVNDALRRKYQSRWPGPLAGMLRQEVLSTTLQLEPA